MASKQFRMDAASLAFMHKAPSSASGAGAMAFLATFARVKMGPLKAAPALPLRQWQPPALLLAWGAARHAASLLAAKAMLLTDLPPDLITLIATWVPIRTLRPVVRFDARLVACTRLQRWYRSSREGWKKSSAPVCVGDRVLVRLNSQSSIYATAAAFIDGPMPSWKLQKLDSSYVPVPVGQVRRLGEWADGPWADTTGRSAALASASRSPGCVASVDPVPTSIDPSARSRLCRSMRAARANRATSAPTTITASLYATTMSPR